MSLSHLLLILAYVIAAALATIVLSGMIWSRGYLAQGLIFALPVVLMLRVLAGRKRK